MKSFYLHWNRQHKLSYAIDCKVLIYIVINDIIGLCRMQY